MNDIFQFMEKLFDAHVRVYGAARQAYEASMKSFFDPSCDAFNPVIHEKSHRTESIVETLQTESGWYVITETQYHGVRPRLRYQLVCLDSGLQIVQVAAQCPACKERRKRAGAADCRFCKGTGWKRIDKSEGEAEEGSKSDTSR